MTQQSLFSRPVVLAGVSAGEALKEEALDSFEARQRSWLEQARDLAADIAREKGQVSTDDLQELIQPPAGAHVNIWGAVFRPERFENIAVVKSRRPTAHARWIGVWRLPDHTAPAEKAAVTRRARR